MPFLHNLRAPKRDPQISHSRHPNGSWKTQQPEKSFLDPAHHPTPCLFYQDAACRDHKGQSALGGRKGVLRPSRFQNPSALGHISFFFVAKDGSKMAASLLLHAGPLGEKDICSAEKQDSLCCLHHDVVMCLILPVVNIDVNYYNYLYKAASWCQCL